MLEKIEEKVSILQHPQAADEDYRVKDLLNYDDKVSAFSARVESTPRRGLIGVVGEYGVGKSVMLNKYRKLYADNPKEAVWVHFDAWKYPDRSNLWEGFVIDFVEQYDEPLFESVRKIIDGEPLTKMNGVIEGSLEMIPVVGKGIGKIFAQFTATTPVRRVFQIQKIFSDLLGDELQRPQPRRIYLEIEDADRSGPAGINFLETLSHFLRNFPVDVEIKALIPIARSSFEDEVNQRAYIKALDIAVDFDLTARDMGSFVETIFNKALINNSSYGEYREYLVDWCQRLLNVYNLTPRDIKFIIRGAEATFQTLRSRGDFPDPLMVFLFESSKMLRDANTGQTFYSKYRQKNSIGSRDVIALFIKAMTQRASVSAMADMINDSSGNIFTNEVRFSTHEKAPTLRFDTRRGMLGAATPESALGHFWIPSYYIEK